RYFGGLCVEAVRALHYVPAVVAAALDYADLLPQVLPSVGNVVLAGLGVPRGTPRVAEAERPALGRLRGVAKDRVIRRDAIAVARVHVGAQARAEEVLGQVLSVAALVVLVPVGDVALARVVRAAAIAERHVQEAIRPKADVAAVVVGLRLVEHEQFALGGGVG